MQVPPNFVATEARAQGDLVRVELHVAPASFRNGFVYSLSPDVADALADQLRAAAKIARIETQRAEKSAASDSGGLSRGARLPRNRLSPGGRVIDFSRIFAPSDPSRRQATPGAPICTTRARVDVHDFTHLATWEREVAAGETHRAQHGDRGDAHAARKGHE